MAFAVSVRKSQDLRFFKLNKKHFYSIVTRKDSSWLFLSHTDRYIQDMVHSVNYDNYGYIAYAIFQL